MTAVKCFECGKFVSRRGNIFHWERCHTLPWFGWTAGNSGFPVGALHPVHAKCQRRRFLPGRPMTAGFDCPGTKAGVLKAIELGSVMKHESAA